MTTKEESLAAGKTTHSSGHNLTQIKSLTFIMLDHNADYFVEQTCNWIRFLEEKVPLPLLLGLSSPPPLLYQEL